MNPTKKNIETLAKELISDYFNFVYLSEGTENADLVRANARGRLHVAELLFAKYLDIDFATVYAEKEKSFKETTKKLEPDVQKRRAKTVKNAAPIRSMEKSEPAPKKAVKTAKKTETTAKKTTKRAVKKAAEIVPINAGNGKPFTGRNKETALAYLKKINSTDGRFYTWGGKKDAGYKVKAGESGLKMAYFGEDSRGTYPVWHISQLVKTVNASAAEEVKETIKREITLDDNDGNGKKKVFKVTVRK